MMYRSGSQNSYMASEHSIIIARVRWRNQYLIYSSNEHSGAVTGDRLFTAVQPKRQKVNAVRASQTVGHLACLGDIGVLQVSAPKTCQAVNGVS